MKIRYVILSVLMLFPVLVRAESADNAIRVSTRRETGVIRPLNGGNLGPSMRDSRHFPKLLEQTKKCNIPIIRLHDEPLGQYGMDLVDLHHLFPLATADAADPRNYNFRTTDAYIRMLIEELGTRVLFRLGPSIEHGERVLITDQPADVDKWIDIVSNVIRHYNYGWADGYRLGIKYWEIWNEPDLLAHQNFNGPLTNYTDARICGHMADYRPFYVKVAKELKKRFPELKFGGPAMSNFERNEEGRRFIEYCAEQGAPLDFFSYHCYSDTPYYERLAPAVHRVRETLDRNGYNKCEIFLDEWNYRVSDQSGGGVRFDRICGIDGAACCATGHILLQDTPLDMGFFYTTGNSSWGLFKTMSFMPNKNYYGFVAVGEMNDYPTRIHAESPRKNVEVLCGRNASGEYALLASAFKAGKPEEFEVNFDRPPRDLSVRLVDAKHNLDPVEFKLEGNRLRVPYSGSSAVLSLRFK